MAYRSSSLATQDNTNALTGTAPAGTTAGDVLVALLTQGNLNSAATLGFPSGWTQVRTDTQANPGASVFNTISWGWKVATGSDSYAFTGSAGTNMAVIVSAYSGRNATPIDLSSFNPGAGSPPTSPITVTATGITTTAADDVIAMGVLSTGFNNGSWAANSPLTLRQSGSSGGSYTAIALADYSPSAGATGDKTFTWTNSGYVDNWMSYLVGLKPAAAGTAYSLSAATISVPVAIKAATLTYTPVGPKDYRLLASTILVPVILGPAYSDHGMSAEPILVPVSIRPVQFSGTATPTGWCRWPWPHFRFRR